MTSPIAGSVPLNRFCVHCGKVLVRQASRKSNDCSFCRGRVLFRTSSGSASVGRCRDCDILICNAYLYCELCGYNTPNGERQVRLKLVEQKKKMYANLGSSALSQLKHTSTSSSQSQPATSQVSKDSGSRQSDTQSWDLETDDILDQLLMTTASSLDAEDNNSDSQSIKEKDAEKEASSQSIKEKDAEKEAST